MLGVSVAPILKSDNAVDLIKAISLTMEEFEYQVSDFAVQKMVRGGHHGSAGAPFDAHRRMRAALRSGPPQKQILRKTGAVGSASSEDENVFAVTPVFQETGVYTHLQLPNVVRRRAPAPAALHGPRRQAADRGRAVGRSFPCGRPPVAVRPGLPAGGLGALRAVCAAVCADRRRHEPGQQRLPRTGLPGRVPQDGRPNHGASLAPRQRRWRGRRPNDAGRCPRCAAGGRRPQKLVDTMTKELVTLAGAIASQETTPLLKGLVAELLPEPTTPAD